MKPKIFTRLYWIKGIIIPSIITIFSITLSIQLNIWYEKYKQQAEINEFLSDLRTDLKKDLTSINIQRAHSGKTVKKYNILANITKRQIDSLKRVHGSLSVPIVKIFRKTNTGSYEGFKSSGKIGSIKDKKLKILILQYYQEVSPLVENIESLLNTQTTEALETISQYNFSKRSFLKDSGKQRIMYIASVLENLLADYEVMATQAHFIINEIDKQVK
jgi:hypothetical protein